MDKLQPLIIALVIILAHFSSSAFEVISTSGHVQLVQGEGGAIWCEADADLDYCTWSQQEQEIPVKCLALAEGESKTCSDKPQVSVSVEGPKCSLNFDAGATRTEDLGTYTCLLTKDRDSADSTVNVDVLVPASLNFQGDFNDYGTVQVNLDSNTLITCSATGGYPTPVVTAMLVNEEGEVIRDLMVMTDMAQENEDLFDGTTEVTQTFLMVPHMEDCGRLVQCAMVQGDQAFMGSEQRKLMVMFAPQHTDLSTPFGFQAGSDYPAVVTIRFMANPPPLDNEAIWQISPTKDEIQPPPPGSFSLAAGQVSDDSRYEALPLNVTGHEVSATLLVSGPQEDLLDGSYYLHVVTSEGEMSYYFKFTKGSQTNSDGKQLR
jgi:hypothetical protein